MTHHGTQPPTTQSPRLPNYPIAANFHVSHHAYTSTPRIHRRTMQLWGLLVQVWQCRQVCLDIGSLAAHHPPALLHFAHHRPPPRTCHAHATCMPRTCHTHATHNI